MPDQAARLAQLVRSGIAEAADPEKAARMRSYMKSAMPYRGVQSTPLRAVLRGLLAEHRLPDRDAWESCVRDLWDTAEFREERYAAIAVTAHRHYLPYQDPPSLPLYRHLVVSGAWWDYVDPLATRGVGPILASHAEQVTPVIRAWAVDDDLWLRRTAVICQLHREADTDLRLLREVIEPNLAGSRFDREFFVRKAIGWALRQHARTDPDWVRAFVSEHHAGLSGLSRREALKHLRVDP